MLTADATPEAKQKSLDAGADLFMTKPIDAKALLTNLIELSSSVEVQTELAEPIKQNAQNQHPLLDLKLLNELSQLGGTEDFIQILIQNFSDDASKHLALIQDAVKDDYLTYRESLHALKGSSTELGVYHLASLCIQGETLQPHQINSDEMHQLVKEIEETYTLSYSALKETFVNT
jgi:two-component system sensor histidine kinase RpfC